ncbi:DUF3667 domain-containing protein [Parasediminibacterium sp. JCM 36343]|uniref:DUF3667 domain-containing protein n=1 Tax=Parasediminibacterium sp. JCM 36343 TaxID=3374279 RepID=UPI00397AE201
MNYPYCILAESKHTMPHSKERKEKNCLNCNATVQGRYCQECGQENIEPKESFWHLATHYFYDITHFDGKFFYTLKYLIQKPGFLSKEYMLGKRNSYLNPIRMYVFTSAIFFLYFFSTFNTEHFGKEGGTESKIEHLGQRMDYVDSLLAETTDPKNKKELQNLKKRLGIKQLTIKKEAEKNSKDTAENDNEEEDTIVNPKKMGYNALNPTKKNTKDSIGAHANKPIEITDGLVILSTKIPDSITTISEFETWQNKLDPKEKPNWVSVKIIRKYFSIKEKYKHSWGDFTELFAEKFLHSFPQMFFLSLPVFALFLKLLYWRKKEFYYVNHLIYAIHQYIATYIFLLFILLLQTLSGQPHFGAAIYLALALIIYSIYYMYAGLRSFYGQDRLKTLIKNMILNFFSLTFIGLLMVLFILLTFLKV